MGKVRLYALLLLAVCAILLFIPFNMYGDKGADIFVIADGLSSYGNSVTGAFPDYKTVPDLPGNLPAALEGNAVSVEAFDFQAAGYLKIGAAKMFYPHYLATMVIAVDRDRTSDPIAGWADLLKGTFTVSLPPGLMRYSLPTQKALPFSGGPFGCNSPYVALPALWLSVVWHWFVMIHAKNDNVRCTNCVDVLYKRLIKLKE